MIGYLARFLMAMCPALTREAAFAWFVAVFAGPIPRTDDYGVTSIVRALALGPDCYNSLPHFFHSSAWQVKRSNGCVAAMAEAAWAATSGRKP